jgi:hypothetical protein
MSSLSWSCSSWPKAASETALRLLRFAVSCSIWGDVLRDVCWLLLRLLDDLGHWSSSLLAALLSDLLEDVFGAVLLESGLSGSSDCIVELGLEGHDLFVLFAS